MAAVIVILLCFLGYRLIKRMRDKKKNSDLSGNVRTAFEDTGTFGFSSVGAKLGGGSPYDAQSMATSMSSAATIE